MQITAALDAELRALGDLVGVPELTTAVHDLLAVCMAAVPSCGAMQVSTPALGPGRAIQTQGMGTIRDGARASLRLDLLDEAGTSSPPVTMSVLLLATRPGAFDSFVGGADPLDRRGFRIVRRSVDEDLAAAPAPAGAVVAGHRPVPLRAGATRPADAVLHTRVVNRALGVLIDRGHPPELALRVLHELAEVAGRTILDQAQHVLDSIAPPALDP